MELGKTVGELSQTMTAAEETHWQALFREEPFGYTRSDMASAQIAQLLFNVNAKKQDRRKLTDFMLFYRKPSKVQENVADNVRSFFGKLVKKD